MARTTQAPKKTPGASSMGSAKSMSRPVRQTVDTSVMESNSSKIADDKIIKPEPQESREPTLKEPFRYRWQRRRMPRQPVAAANKGEASKRPFTDREKATKSKARKQVSDNNDDDFMQDGGDEAALREESDGSIASGEDQPSDDEEDGSQQGLETPPKSARKAKPARNFGGVRHRDASSNRLPIPENNGRHHGRRLVPWHKPRMIEKLLFHVMYESHLQGIKLPWDAAVHRLCPGSSGQTAIQHIHKLRDIIVSEGHLVPPQMGKGSNADPNVRGYVRDMESEIPTDTRVLGWDEPYEDLKDNLVIPGVVRGSGNYKKIRGYLPATSTTVEKLAKPADGSRRRRLPAELIAAKKEKEEEQLKIKTERKERRVTRKVPRAKKFKAPSSSETISATDPVDGDSSDEYDPLAFKGRSDLRKHFKRGERAKALEIGDEDLNEEETNGDTGRNKATPDLRPGLMVTLKLSPDSLRKFPTGTNGIPENSFKDEIDKEQGDEGESEEEAESEEDGDEQNGSVEQYKHTDTAEQASNASNGVDAGYVADIFGAGHNFEDMDISLNSLGSSPFLDFDTGMNGDLLHDSNVGVSDLIGLFENQLSSDNTFSSGDLLHGVGNSSWSLPSLDDHLKNSASQTAPGLGYAGPEHPAWDMRVYSTSTSGANLINPQDVMATAGRRRAADAFAANLRTTEGLGFDSTGAQYHPHDFIHIATDSTATGTNSRAQPAATASQIHAPLPEYDGYGEQANKENHLTDEQYANMEVDFDAFVNLD